MSEQDAAPDAELVPLRRPSIAWLLPLAALALVGLFGWRVWQQAGVVLSVTFAEGHGLEAGDTVRYRGIVVGEISAVELDGELERVVLEVRLDPRARNLAQSGARFWVVRPEISAAGVVGLETLVGARYLAVLPGPASGRPQREFIGLEEGPALAGLEPGGLEVVLVSPRIGSLRRGSPVTFRQIEVGRIVSVGLASDGNSVEARAYIEPSFAPVVREATHFWRTSGFEFEAGLQGVRVRSESLRTLVLGGVALATPDEPGAGVRTGHRFALHDEAAEGSVDWQPSIPVGSSLLPAGAALPRPLKASLTWKEGRILTSDEQREGWVLSVGDGILGPPDLLRAPDGAYAGSAALEVAGRRFVLDESEVREQDGVAILVTRPPSAAWPSDQSRAPSEPEDCILVGDPTATPLAISASRLELADDGAWIVDERLPLDGRWHGASVLSRGDGARIGLVVVDGSDARIVVRR